ncbi:ACP S-malonyltransferase [Streptomyces sp. KM273126]|uniref:ACP S-malonyltransferase n=1 Tax=Streptomyces sp. KM273126 TaxID=2545247 RepID=UPI00104090F6|nr:ACP S-malonyltransferase [Streptomyces sp. KM273126]MBA2807339.1 ACP S-malonyltransferase [Streptomyces sp. KM273126]
MMASTAGAPCVLFPGQGSQARGMGSGLFDRFPGTTSLANDVLGYDLPRLCLQDPEGRLDDTRFTQPALYVVNALSYRDSLERGEPEAEYLLGHSLGEYNALHAAGVFDFETGLKLVIKRGELMARASDGAMLAVVGMSESELRAFLAEESLARLDIANLNTGTQTVLSGARDEIERAHRLLGERSVRAVPLKVSAAFHSRFMAPARDEFHAFLKGFRFSPPRATVIANLTARPYDAEVPGTLSEQIAAPVRWAESVRYLLERTSVEDCREAGDGSVLTRMVRQIAAEAGSRAGGRPSTAVAPRRHTEPDTEPHTPGARPLLFCVAYAGGDERAYAPLTEHCRDIELVALERPGRGRRAGEPLLREPAAIVDDLFAQLRGRLGAPDTPDTPYALYGHSLGARLAFLLCRRLRAEGLPPPVHLFVSGESGPAIPSRERDTWRLPDEAFRDHLKQLGGIPAELWEYGDLMAFYERVLRADFTALGACEHMAEPPLDIPVTAMAGEDEWFSRADIDAWQRETTRPLTVHWFPGDHFFIRTQWPALARIVTSGLAAA